MLHINLWTYTDFIQNDVEIQYMVLETCHPSAGMCDRLSHTSDSKVIHDVASSKMFFWFYEILCLPIFSMSATELMPQNVLIKNRKEMHLQKCAPHREKPAATFLYFQ